MMAAMNDKKHNAQRMVVDYLTPNYVSNVYTDVVHANAQVRAS